MKTRYTLNNVLPLVALTIIVALLLAPWQSATVQAVQGSEDPPSDFSFTDLSAGQTARLTVVNPRRTPPPHPDQPPLSDPGNSTLARRVRLAFDVYVPAEPDPLLSCISRYVLLLRETCDVLMRPGEVVSYDYTSGRDVKVVGSIQALGGPDTREGDGQLTPEPHLAPMLEVREGTRTLFVVPAVIKSFSPQSDSPVTR